MRAAAAEYFRTQVEPNIFPEMELLIREAPVPRRRPLGRQFHLRLGRRGRRPPLPHPARARPRCPRRHRRQRPRHRPASRRSHRRRQSCRPRPGRHHRARRCLRQLRPRRRHARHRAPSVPRQPLTRAPHPRRNRKLAHLLPRLCLAPPRPSPSRSGAYFSRRHSDSKPGSPASSARWDGRVRISVFVFQLTTDHLTTDNMLLEGLHIPLTTPFHPDGRLNPHKLAANVVRYSKTPAAGLIALGPTGEPTVLSDDETSEALRAAARGRRPGEAPHSRHLSRQRRRHPRPRQLRRLARTTTPSSSVFRPSSHPESGRLPNPRFRAAPQPLIGNSIGSVTNSTSRPSPIAPRSPSSCSSDSARAIPFEAVVARSVAAHSGIVGLCVTRYSAENPRPLESDSLRATRTASLLSLAATLPSHTPSRPSPPA